ncbi:MAG: hypothetical protein R3E79_51975 [Caldilineaceae bacterium]
MEEADTADTCFQMAIGCIAWVMPTLHKMRNGKCRVHTGAERNAQIIQTFGGELRQISHARLRTALFGQGVHGEKIAADLRQPPLILIRHAL